MYNLTLANKTLNYSEKKALHAQILHLAKVEANKKSFPDEEKKKLGHSLVDILVECAFNARNCSEQDFIWSFDQNLGNCYTHNTSYLSYQSNRFKSLYFVMYTGYNQSLTSSNYPSGLVMRIENSSNLELNSDGILLGSGMQTDIGIERKFRRQLAKPYSDCDIEDDQIDAYPSDLYNLFIRSGYKYTRHDCLDMCMQKILVNECNCTNMNFKSFYQRDNCESFMEIECMNRVTELFRSVYISSVCIPLCPLECNKYEFVTSLNVIQSDMEAFKDFIESSRGLMSDFEGSEFKSGDLKNNLVSATIFLESFSYELLTESAKMDLPTLFSNIGGIIG